MEEKIQCVQIRQVESLHISLDHTGEMIGDTLDCELALQQRKPFRLQRDYADIGRVTLVTRASMRDVEQSNLHQTIATLVVTVFLSTSAGQYATISSTFGRPPANPVTLGGPFRTRGAISRVKRSTAALSSPRTPKRS